MWAGVECTVNRVGDEYFDQLERNGHATRLDDLDRFAALGIRAIRYPVLWERVAPNGLEKADWSWTDERLERLRELGVCPIVGLVHHGSGPRDTSLIDSAFPERLAEFAHAVSDRYPWVTHYTPVNEPLTTARFSGLYGHWYPHGRDDLTFLRALLVQCRSVALSMQAIRRVNPDAQLVQTEDMGKTFSTPLLAYQAELENQRRWLSLDLLCGRINPDHSLWHYFCQAGIEAAELEWFLEHPCPPDIIGINYYLTSDRLLDEQLEKYPTPFHGGNGQHEYADVEAVRVCGEGVAGHYRLLRETWERYQLPVAVTEVHLCCTREEQLRWLKQAWNAAQQLRGEGVDIRAITAWSLLGAYDWNSLVTRANNFYEPGVFDLRSPTPRATALATMVSHFSQGKTYEHPILETPGWWQRPERLFYPAVNCNFSSSPTTSSALHSTLSPLVITGATGTLGQAFARICDIRGIPYRLLTRQEMNITDIHSVERSLDELKPWAVINTAGYVRVDDAEREPHLCQKINADGAAILAQACVERSVGLVTFSSDLVFDGTHTKPYLESHQVSPLNVYGHSKAVAEKWVLQAHPCSLVIRTSAFFGPWDRHNFLTILLQTLAAGNPFVAANDAIVSPTYVPDLVNTTLDLLIDGECGLWHLANPGAIAWAELAQFTAKLAGMDVSRIEARPSHSLGWIAPRPIYSALGSERGTLLPELDQAIARYLRERLSV
jgi:dTDP-4-dehydrorhamnose reductase